MNNDELNNLKKENEMLKERIRTLEEKKYTKVDLGLSPHVNSIRYNDGVYRVLTQYISKDFKIDSRYNGTEYFNEILQNMALEAEFIVKDAYIKSGVEWMMESNPCPAKFENLKIYINKYIPRDSIFINPYLWSNIEIMIINNTERRTKMQDVVRYLVDNALERSIIR